MAMMCVATFYLFAHSDIFSPDSLFSDSFSDTLSSDSLSSLTLHTTVAASVHKSEVSVLNFLR